MIINFRIKESKKGIRCEADAFLSLKTEGRFRFPSFKDSGFKSNADAKANADAKKWEIILSLSKNHCTFVRNWNIMKTKLIINRSILVLLMLLISGHVWANHLNLRFCLTLSHPSCELQLLNSTSDDSNPTLTDTTTPDYSFYQVTDASSLSDGDQIIITNVVNCAAMSTTQNNNNRAQTPIELKDGIITNISDQVQLISLEQNSSSTWLLNVGNGYLYAPSNSENILQTTNKNDSKRYAEIIPAKLKENALTIHFTGSKRSYIGYNDLWENFCCYYNENNQKYIEIFKRYTTVSVKEGTNGRFYATYASSNYNLDFSQVEGLNAYIVTDQVDGGALTLQKVEKVPANTPVLVCGTQATSYQVPTNASAASVSTNLLKIATTDTYGDGSTIFVLSSVSGVMGFSRVEVGKVIPAGQIYLELPKGVPSKPFYDFTSTDLNAITSVLTDAITPSAQFYHVNGQRVRMPLQQGIYIINGKKVFLEK